MCPRKLEICPRIHLPRLSSSAARVSVDTMPAKKKKGTRPQPVLGTRVASAPAQQLPPALPVAAAGVKAEDPQRDSVQTVSDPSVPSASAKPVNVAVPEINQELIALVVKARTTIVDHAYFAGATTSAPLGMSSSANLMNGGHHRTAYDKVLCFKNLQELGVHECNMNVFQLDWYKGASRIAPANKAKMQSVQQHVAGLLKEGEWPAHMGLTIAIRMPAMNVDKNLESALASCVHISPLEFLWGILIACAEAVENNPTDDVTLEKVRRTLLTCKVMVRIDSGDATKFWQQAHLRNSLTTVGQVAQRTAVQRAMDIWESKQLLDAQLGQSLGAQATAEHWHTHVGDSAGDEKLTASLVDAAFTVMKRFLATDAAAATYAIKMDSLGLNPIDSIYKWEGIIKRAPSKDYVGWCVTGIIDASRSGLIQPGELSVRQLTGKGLAGGKGPRCTHAHPCMQHAHACTCTHARTQLRSVTRATAMPMSPGKHACAHLLQ